MPNSPCCFAHLQYSQPELEPALIAHASRCLCFQPKKKKKRSLLVCGESREGEGGSAVGHTHFIFFFFLFPSFQCELRNWGGFYWQLQLHRPGRGARRLDGGVDKPG